MRVLLACVLAVLLTLSPLAASDSKPPTVPRNLSVGTATATSVSLVWQASTDFKGGSGVAGYDILRNGAAVGTTAAVTFTDESVASATTYQYAVRARDNAGNVSVPSTPVTVATPGEPCGAPPEVPEGLTATATSSSTIQLSWTEVTPPAGCAVTYTVHQDGVAIVSGILATTYTVGGLEPGAAYSFAVSAQDSIGSSGPSVVDTETTLAGGAGSPGFPAKLFAPYVDVLLWPTPSLSSMAAQSGSKYFSAGFIVAGSGCQATWGRHYTMSESFLKDDIAALRAMGGDVVASLGGAAGTELALACSTVESLRIQYQSVVNAYGFTRLDFDIEGSALGNTTANDRRAKAIAALQAAVPADGPRLTIQFTLPVMPSGLTPDGVALMQNAIENNVDIGVVNVMAMDYGRSYTDSMGGYAVSAMEATIAKLKTLYAQNGIAKTDIQVRAMVGVTPMIGLNDVSPEVFTFSDAVLLVDAAQDAGIGFLSIWSATRDQPCVRRQVVSPTCSGVPQTAWDFTRIFLPFISN